MKVYPLTFCLIATLVLLFCQDTSAQTPSKIKRLEDLLELSEIDSSRVKILNALTDEYLLVNPLKAQQYAEEALQLSQNSGYLPGQIKSTDNLARVYNSQKAYNKSIEYYQKAVNLKQQANDPIGMADNFNKIGNAYVLLGQTQVAINFYQRSLQINNAQLNQIGIATTHTNLGVAYYQESNYTTSIFHHIQALNIADSLRASNLLSINLNSLGKNYLRQREFSNALKCYRQLLHIGQSNTDRPTIEKAYQGLSQVYAEQGEYKKAYEYHQFYSSVREAMLIDKTKSIKQIATDTETQLIEKQLKLELVEQENERRTIVNYFAATALMLLLVIIFILFRNRKLIRQKHRLLNDQTQALELQKEEIETKRSELENQKRKIERQNRSIQRKNETLEATFKEIERKNKDITASINYAKRIQESMLPPKPQIKKCLPESFIFFQPRDIVSGDFYWFSEKNGKVVIAAVDCTGHGVPGAIMSMLGDSYLNQIINLQGITEPDVVLTELHKNIGIALNQQENNNQDGMDVALCVIDYEAKKLEYAGASRPLIIIQDEECQEIQSSRLPIGGFQKDRPREFNKTIIDIDKPTRFYVFSDGFQDQFGGRKGRKFAKSRLIKLLNEHHLEPMFKQEKILKRELNNWMGQNRQMDDILVIGVEI